MCFRVPELRDPGSRVLGRLCGVEDFAQPIPIRIRVEDGSP